MVDEVMCGHIRYNSPVMDIPCNMRGRVVALQHKIVNWQFYYMIAVQEVEVIGTPIGAEGLYSQTVWYYTTDYQ